jgi:Fe-S cluster assembly ATPase SufC
LSRGPGRGYGGQPAGEPVNSRGGGTADYQARIKEFDEILELREFWDTRARQLSLGQRVRCDLAAALLHDPPVVFLDEPTIGMDVVVKQQVREVSAGLDVTQATTHALLGVLYLQFRTVDRWSNGESMVQLMMEGTIAFWFLRPVSPPGVRVARGRTAAVRRRALRLVPRAAPV